jgi:hypothetical protein
MVVDPNRRRQSSEDDDEFGGGGTPKKKGLTINPIALSIGAVLVSILAVYLLFSPTSKISSVEVDKKLTDYQTTMTKTVTDKITPLIGLQQTITDSVTKQISAAVANVPTVQSVQSAQTMAQSAQTAADSAKTIANDAKSTIGSVKAVADKAQSDLTIANNSISTLNKQNSELVVEINALKTTNTTLQSDIASMKSNYTTLNNTVSSHINGTTSTGIVVDTSDLTVNVVGSRLILDNIGNIYGSSYTNYTALKFRITNKSAADITVYELKLNLQRYKYNGSNNLEDYDIGIASSSAFSAGDNAFVLDDSSSTKLVYTSSRTYDVSANSYDDFTVYVRAKFNTGYADMDLANNSYYLRLTPTMSVTDFDKNN